MLATRRQVEDRGWHRAFDATVRGTKPIHCLGEGGKVGMSVLWGNFRDAQLWDEVFEMVMVLSQNRRVVVCCK